MIFITLYEYHSVTIFTKLYVFLQDLWHCQHQKGDVSDVLLYDLSCETNRSVHHRCGRSGCLVAFNDNKDLKFYLQPNRDLNRISSGPLECIFFYFIL